MREAQTFLATIESDAGVMKTLAVISILALRKGRIEFASEAPWGRQQCFRLINS
jgi:hypothetical protein